MTIHRRAHRLREAAVAALQAGRAALQAAPGQAVGTPARRETAADPLAPVRILAHPVEARVVPPALRVPPVPRAPPALRAVAAVAALMAVAQAVQAVGATEGRRRQR